MIYQVINHCSYEMLGREEAQGHCHHILRSLERHVGVIGLHPYFVVELFFLDFDDLAL